MDVCIIGAGWSGLYACKYALENGLNPIVLERRGQPGGVWNFSDDAQTTTVMKSTVSSSSRLVTEASDFFMDESVGHFMHHEEVLDYLKAYIENFGLAKYIQYGAHVQSVEKQGQRWLVTYFQDGIRQTVDATNVAVCAGLHNKQREIGAPVSNFAGSVVHSGNIKGIRSDEYSANDHVIVYGGGETASDVIDMLVATPAKITWAIRGGQHFLRKTLYHQRDGVGQFDKHDFALDTIASPLINGASSFSKGAPGRRYITDFLSTGSVMKYQGHGIAAWKNNYRYAQQFFNKNGHTVDHVHQGRVAAENEILGVCGHEVEFKSGNRASCTHIICCFGYEFHCPFLPEKYANGKLEDHYQFVFPTDDTSIAFLGFTRPIIGSIPMVTEMQCLWANRVWAGKVQLPEESKLVQKQKEINDNWQRKLPDRGRTTTLVLPATYVAMMIKEAYPGRSPGEHFKRMPLRALKFLSWQPSASMRFAVDPAIDDERFDQLWQQRSHGIFLGYILPIIILISRFLQIEKFVDWYVDWSENRRYSTRNDDAEQQGQAVTDTRGSARRAA